MSRGVVALVLVIVAGVLAGPAVAAFALDRRITDEGRYLAAVGPLGADPVVRREIAGRVSQAVNEKLSLLPDSAHRLVEQTVTRLVDSESFRRAWVSINRVAHPRMIAMLRDEPGSLRIENDTVLLDVGEVAGELKARLVADGLPLADRLPEITADIPLFSRPAVRQAIPAFGTMQAVKIVLPVVVVALIAAGVIISRRRARTLIVAGGAVALAMLILASYEWIARSRLVARSQSPDLAAGYYDALTGSLHTLLWVVFGAGVVLALAGVAGSRRAHV